MNLLPSPQSTKEIAQKLPQIDGYREINSKQLATYELSPMVGSSGDSSLSEKIRFQQLKLSAFHGNKESALQLGHCYIRGTCGLVSYDASQAILWYTRAASLDFPLASLYLGVIYHFGIKETPINVVRANRYYDDALKSDKLDTQLQIMTNSLKYMLGMRSYSVFKPLSIGLDYVIQKLWGSL